VDPSQVEEADPCGLCGDPMIEGATGSWEQRGSFHVVCIRAARREIETGQARHLRPHRGGR